MWYLNKYDTYIQIMEQSHHSYVNEQCKALFPFFSAVLNFYIGKEMILNGHLENLKNYTSIRMPS
jgi:hypothetical protein